jgi:hypothetical protein
MALPAANGVATNSHKSTKKKQQGNCLRQVGATDLPAAGNQNPRPIFAAGKSLWLTLVHSVAHIP